MTGQRLVTIPESGMPQFDELYVISDLHIGGSPGFQIFNSALEMKGLIDALRVREPERKIALLINGDFVDFLAEDPNRHFDPDSAVRKLDRVVSDSAFAPAWEALRNYTRTRNRRLLVNIGNHDLELALPWVRERLLETLCGGDDAARGRIVLAFDGAGVRCRVGGATVLCVHGNEVDDWNVADYETIRRLGRDIEHGLPVETWVPNAGSRLVIEVMNDLKRRFSFVDLLKPEKQGVIPTLLALAPDQHDKLRAIAGTARQLVLDKLRRAVGLLGEEEPGGTRTSTLPPMRQRPSRQSSERMHLEFGGSAHTAALLLEIENRIDDDPLSLVESDQLGEELGLTSAVMKLFRGEDAAEILREALEDLQNDRSFDLKDPDDTFKALDEQIGSADFLTAGHTHLARALPRQNAPGWYFNSGTWARLVRLEKDALQDAAKFKQVFSAFKAGTMEALDNFPELVRRDLTVVAIWSENGSTHGELRRMVLKAGDGSMIPIPDTHFKKD